MPRKLALAGGGGFAREVLDIVNAINAASSPDAGFEVVGVFDDGSPDLELLQTFGVESVGTVEEIHELPASVEVVVAIAHPSTRREILSRLGDRRFAVLLHPSSTVGRAVRLGDGTVVCAQVSLANHITLGEHTQVGANAAVGHDVVTGRWCTLSPAAAVSGNVTLGDEVFIGTGSSIRQGLHLKSRSVVGSGAAVVDDVEVGVTVVGVPAKPRYA